MRNSRQAAQLRQQQLRQRSVDGGWGRAPVRLPGDAGLLDTCNCPAQAHSGGRSRWWVPAAYVPKTRQHTAV